jgi:ribosomal protein S18 acetylase RimI-like enzyme
VAKKFVIKQGTVGAFMDQSKSLTIRKATLNDLDRVTELHLASFRPEEHVPVMLGPRYVRATYRWQIDSPEAYTLVAEADAKVVGLVGMCDKSFTRPMFMACFGEFILSILTKPSLLFQRKLWERLLRDSKSSSKGEMIGRQPGMAQMTIGAVDGDYRGYGVFPALVEATKSYSKARGSRAIRAGVYKINNSSRRVFVKGGWIESPELETSDTVFFVAYLDPGFPKELGINLP